MAESAALRTRGLLCVRNGAGIIAMVSLCAAARALVNQAVDWFAIQGIHQVTTALGAAGMSGAVGYFFFAGTVALRTWLVFLSVILLGLVGVLFYDPDKTFYPLLTSIPFAAVASLAAAVVGRFAGKRRSRLTSDAV